MMMLRMRLASVCVRRSMILRRHCGLADRMYPYGTPISVLIRRRQ